MTKAQRFGTMKIADHVEVLELTLNLLGNTMTIHPAVIRNVDSYVLVDTGTPGSDEDIRELIRQAGIEPSQLHSIIVTHQDIDHIGSLPHFLADHDGTLDVYAHEDDKPYIDGERAFIKGSPEVVRAILQPLPEGRRREFEDAFSPSTPPNVNRVVVDGELLPFGGGLRVIHTPGHTPGHISLYHEPSRTLIAGDAMVVHNGELLGPNPQNTPDMETAIQSLQKFKNFDVRSVVCYHGGLFEGDLHGRINELTAAYRASISTEKK
ncbi:MBL fold metallo-hydrolase [Paenibacillus hodogayensis]|uniref:MBL fold metallo-hydrolase n=2 Tax=Paenibacillus hodogayensis TaxID=279208 RepID=UPI0031EBE8CC